MAQSLTLSGSTQNSKKLTWLRSTIAYRDFCIDLFDLLTIELAT